MCAPARHLPPNGWIGGRADDVSSRVNAAPQEGAIATGRREIPATDGTVTRIGITIKLGYGWPLY